MAELLRPGGPPVSGEVGGYTVTLTPPKDKAPPSSTPGRPERMLAGVTVDPGQYENRLPLYANNGVTRVFGYPGSGLPEWQPTKADDRIHRILQLAPGVRIAATFKDWNGDKEARRLVDDWLNQAPASAETYGIDLDHMHEADAKRFNMEENRRRHFLLAEWLAQHPRGHWVDLTPTQTLQWTMAKSSKGNVKGDGDVTKYYVGVGTPAMDCYVGHWETAYPDPAKFLEPVFRLQDAAGKPAKIPEFGTARLKFDKTGTARADFIEAVATVARQRGIATICYWDDLGTGGTDLRLTSENAEDGTPLITPEVEAWRRVLAGNVPTV